MRMKKYTILCKNDDQARHLKKKIQALLMGKMEEDGLSPDFVISIGGDGTLLKSIHQYETQLDQVIFVGIHAGTLGFLTNYQAEDLEKAVANMLEKTPRLASRGLLEVDVNHESRYLAFNEVRLENSYMTQIVDVYIDQQFLETFRGTGICISGSAGSTAYNKSLGGAIVFPDLSLLQLSEIAGIHHNAYRSLGNSLVLSSQHEITCHVEGNAHTILGVDQMVFPVPCSCDLTIRLHPDRKVRFLCNEEHTFVSRLRKAYII